MGPEPVKDHPVAGMHIWGWMTPAELTWLREQAATMGSVAEVGCLHGRSAFALLTGCDGPVYCIDPWNDGPDGTPPGHGSCYRSFMGACGHFPNLVAIPGYSPAAVDQVPDVDMVFIDGDHSYEAVLADIDAWLPKTRKLICGHDFQNVSGAFPGVAQAVRERFGEPEVAVSTEETAIWAVRI